MGDGVAFWLVWRVRAEEGEILVARELIVDEIQALPSRITSMSAARESLDG